MFRIAMTCHRFLLELTCQFAIRLINQAYSLILKTPALIFSLYFLLGIYFCLCFNYLLIPYFILLSLPLLTNNRNLLLLKILFLLIGYSYAFFSVPLFEASKEEQKVYAKIESIEKKDTIAGLQWKYETKISIPNTLHKNLAATIYLKDSAELNRPLGDSDYVIHGKFKKANNGLQFVPTKSKPWISNHSYFRFSEIRFQLKDHLANHIKTKNSNKQTGDFLAGITTGQLENRLLSYELTRFGLQHILAISGFHFSILASILTFFISIFFKRKHSIILAIFGMTSYFIFLGFSPSIFRAWSAISLSSLSQFVERPTNALNFLGISLLIVLVIDPLAIYNIGFQYSFLITASILIFYKPCNLALKQIFPLRPLSTLIEMNRLNQKGVIVLAILRQGIALLVAVNLVALPLTMYHFGSFPLFSLLYNLFFPFLAGISLFILCIALIFDVLIPPLGNIVHSSNNFFTSFLLDYVHQLPKNLDVIIEYKMSLNILLTWYLILLLCSYLLNRKHSICC